MGNILYGRELRVLPLGSAGKAEDQKLYARHRLELERRTEFVRRYQQNCRESDVQALDPVLRHHLGLADLTCLDYFSQS